MKIRSTWFLLSCCGAAVVFCGCGSSQQPPLGAVTGVVKVNGAPVANLMVVFEPQQQGRASVGRTKENGQYELSYNSMRKGAELGSHVVRIEGMDGEDAPAGVPKIPSEFNSKSTLTADVNKGSNTLNFDLEFDPKAKSSKKATSNAE